MKGSGTKAADPDSNPRGSVLISFLLDSNPGVNLLYLVKEKKFS
jgi:hypothetical protein